MALQGDFIRSADVARKYFVPYNTDLQVDASSVSSEWTTDSEPENEAVSIVTSPYANGQGTDTSNLSNPFVGEAVPGTEGAGDASRGKKKRKKRLWRMRYKVPRHVKSDFKTACFIGGGGATRTGTSVRSSSSSSSGSSSSSSRSSRSSSSTSSGSSSTSGGEVARQKRQRRQIIKEWEAQKVMTQCRPQAAVDGFQPPPPPKEPFSVGQPSPPADENMPLIVSPSSSFVSNGHCGLQWFSSEKRYRNFALAAGFLDLEEIRAIHRTAAHQSVREINDRKGYLAFKHRVWRFELQLRALCPELYNRLMALMHRADAVKWRRMTKKSRKLYPEIEYIDYDVQEMGEPCFIEPHVDNKSAVTLVAMLTAPGEYVGGRSCFRRADGRRGNREVCLQQGDVVLFRGEKLVHWITPVTAGKRTILQIELSRV
eukprot:TRINITY_DN2363_c4_g1_i1.p1 TRINITY_DN2363_c4_g1~~TRINITY_DN2363_c4_g1_i1.p1  ORF type:complete len:427 (+),score=70.10 TRINITY_DN2363_c4_g1_i1:250-1530(+)